MKYYIRVRTPDDPTGWTAKGEGEVGTPYYYSSSGIAVELSFQESIWRKQTDSTYLQFNPAPKPSSTKKVRGRKTIDPVNDE